MLRPIKSIKDTVEHTKEQTLKVISSRRIPRSNESFDYTLIGENVEPNVIQISPNYDRLHTSGDRSFVYIYFNVSYDSTGRLRISYEIGSDGKLGVKFYRLDTSKFDITINNTLCYKWCTFDSSTEKFKAIFKHVDTYYNGMKYLELRSTSRFDYIRPDFTSFQNMYQVSYLLEDGSLAAPYMYSPSGPTYWYEGYDNQKPWPTMIDVSANIKIPEMIDILKEKKKLLNLKHKYSSPKIYKLNYLFYGGELYYA